MKDWLIAPEIRRTGFRARSTNIEPIVRFGLGSNRWLMMWKTPDGVYHCPLGTMRPRDDGTWEMTHKYPEFSDSGWMESGV